MGSFPMFLCRFLPPCLSCACLSHAPRASMPSGDGDAVWKFLSRTLDRAPRHKPSGARSLPFPRNPLTCLQSLVAFGRTFVGESCRLKFAGLALGGIESTLIPTSPPGGPMPNTAWFGAWVAPENRMTRGASMIAKRGLIAQAEENIARIGMVRRDEARRGTPVPPRPQFAVWF